jgi:hypothetical protein
MKMVIKQPHSALHLFQHFHWGISIEGPAASVQIKIGASSWAVALGKATGRQPARFGQLPATLNRETSGLLFFFVSDQRAFLGLLARVQPSFFAPAS